MKEIVTVNGRIEKEALGICQCHEHLALAMGESYKADPNLWFDDEKKSAQEADLYRKAGGDSLIEAQPTGCGRMACMLQQISSSSGVNIIASTGFHKMLFYPEDHWIKSSSFKELEEVFVSELEEGMYIDADGHFPKDRCPSRAGIIKTAYDREELTARYEILFAAAAAAAIKCDRVMMIHVEQGADPVKLMYFLKKEGVSPQNMIFCHMDRACEDLDMHREILKSGAFLEYDTIGRFKYHSDEREIEIIQAMLDAGYEDQILYSLDTTRARLRAYCAEAIGLDYILRVFNKKLLGAGISEEIIKKFAVENPARVLAG